MNKYEYATVGPTRFCEVWIGGDREAIGHALSVPSFFGDALRRGMTD